MAGTPIFIVMENTQGYGLADGVLPPGANFEEVKSKYTIGMTVAGTDMTIVMVTASQEEVDEYVTRPLRRSIIARTKDIRDGQPPSADELRADPSKQQKRVVVLRQGQPEMWHLLLLRAFLKVKETVAAEELEFAYPTDAQLEALPPAFFRAESFDLELPKAADWLVRLAMAGITGEL